MPKVKIGRDEYWPWPILNDRRFGYGPVEVDRKTLKRWRDGLAAADKLVAEIWDEVERQTGQKA